MQGCSCVQSTLGSQSALIDWESTAVLRNSQLFSHFQFDRKKNLKQPFSGSFSRKQWGKWEGSSQEEDTKLTILFTCLMKSHAVSGQKVEKNNNKKTSQKTTNPNNQIKKPNQKTKQTSQPHALAWKKRYKQLLRRRPYWETLQKGSLLFISMQPSRTFLSGHQTSWDGNWSCPEVELNASIYKPEFFKLLLPGCLTLLVRSPHSGPGCSAHQNNPRSTAEHLLWKGIIIWFWMCLPFGWERNV